MKKNFLPKMILSTAFIFSITPKANAQEFTTSQRFKALFESALSPQDKPQIHELMYDPGHLLNSMLKANTVDEAMGSIQNLSLLDLAKSQTNLAKLNSETILQKRKNPLTIVIVPGIFGEFIPNRPFEEILSGPSQFREDFKKLIETSQKQGRLDLVMDPVGSLQQLSPIQTDLTNVIHVSSIDQKNKILARIVYLNTPFASLETLGDVDQRAHEFNRRLKKYLAITGKQDLVLVGYSRGVTFALSMLAQAQKNQENWLKQVRGVVSLGGVVFGTSLVDDFQSNPQKAQLMGTIAHTAQNLKSDGTPESQIQNAKLLKVLTDELAKNQIESNLNPSFEKPMTPIFETDKIVPLKLVQQLLTELKMTNVENISTDGVLRTQVLLQNILVGVQQLSSEERTKWWKTNTIPSRGIKYYSIVAAQADPDRSEYEKQIYLNESGYAQSQNLGLTMDDASLLGNHREYQAITGLSLNDSQVSIAQASFSNPIIQRINPQQKPIVTRFLGIAGTHHWGLALQVVNPMKDQRVNPFPRRALLQALAAQVTLDNL